MINILIGENIFLIDKKIKNLTSDYTLLIYNNFSDFFLNFKITNIYMGFKERFSIKI